MYHRFYKFYYLIYIFLNLISAPTTTENSMEQQSSESSSGLFGTLPLNPDPNPNSVFSPSLNSNSPVSVKRLSSFRKERDLTLKRPSSALTHPPNSPLRNIKVSPSKRVRLSSNSSDNNMMMSPAHHPPSSPEKAVIIESGPLSVEPASVEPDSEADDFEEDENEILSAKDLLSRHTGEVYEDDEDEYYY